MQEEGRVIRCYSEDTERPYFQIRYRLSLTGRELLADALGNGLNGLSQQQQNGNGGFRNIRSSSVSTTLSNINDIQEHEEYNNDFSLNLGLDGNSDQQLSHRVARSRSLEAPSDNSNVANLNAFSDQVPGTPRSNYRRSQQKKFTPSGSNSFNNSGSSMDIDEGRSGKNGVEHRRTKSAGTETELQLNRGAPAIPVASLYDNENHLKSLQEVYPQFNTEFQGLITCLNSKNVRKYRIGQPYRKGVIIGIDEDQGKIIVFQKNMPFGTLVVMKSENPSRYEKGYTVQDVQGRTLGSVHAIDKKQKLLVINTTTTNGNSSLYNIQY